MVESTKQRLAKPCPVTVVPDGQRHIRIRGLHKTFGENRVLRGVDLDVAEGETVVILGVSGSGKTTLFKHLMGIYRIEEGQITVHGWDLATMGRGAWSAFRRNMGVVFQHAALLGSLNVAENVGLPLREVSRLPDDEVLRRVCRALHRVFLPAAEILELKPADLSGGMRKRVGLARAIIQDPDLILYDEPTTGLDPVTVSGVNEMIQEMQRELGVTSIVITHDIDAACEIADRIAFLYEGIIVACGTVDEIRSHRHEALRQLLSGDTSGPLTEDFVTREKQSHGRCSAVKDIFP